MNILKWNENNQTDSFTYVKSGILRSFHIITCLKTCVYDVYVRN